FTVRPGPMPGTLSHNGTHFSVSVPPGWEATPDVASGGGTADAVLVDSLTGTSVVIVSEGRSLQGTTAEARAILQEAIDGLSTRTGFAILEPVHDRVVDGHPAAEVYLTWQPSTYNLNADIIVVVGAEWQQFWALSGSSYSWFGPGSRTCLNWTAQRFDIADVPFATAIPMFLERYSLWILVTGLVATTGDLAHVAKLVHIPVFAQHVDAVEAGPTTGWSPPEALLEAGAAGTLINHSERKVAWEEMAKSIPRCQELGLEVVACADDISEA